MKGGHDIKKMRILHSQVITRISLEKFHHNLNNKLISATSTFNDFVLKVNLSRS